LRQSARDMQFGMGRAGKEWQTRKGALSSSLVSKAREQ
jgi:biotin-(acetyl-CoA carboxylase) ligase